MTSIEIKLSISGEKLESLRLIAGTIDDKEKLRARARIIFNTALDGMALAMKDCLAGRISSLEEIEEEEKESEQ